VRDLGAQRRVVSTRQLVEGGVAGHHWSSWPVLWHHTILPDGRCRPTRGRR
jgi:hypothetical protein